VNATLTTALSTLSLHDALPIFLVLPPGVSAAGDNERKAGTLHVTALKVDDQIPPVGRRRDGRFVLVALVRLPDHQRRVAGCRRQHHIGVMVEVAFDFGRQLDRAPQNALSVARPKLFPLVVDYTKANDPQAIAFAGGPDF